jgi:hypothetical protein
VFAGPAKPVAWSEEHPFLTEAQKCQAQLFRSDLIQTQMLEGLNIVP